MSTIQDKVKLILELLLFPEIEQDAFEMEKEVVLEEIAQNIDQPDEIIYMKLLKECLTPHRYSKPILGNKKTVKNINDFHKYGRSTTTGNKLFEEILY